MQTDSFAGMFDQNAEQWARQEPMILWDFTARPLVLQELAPLTGKHVLDLGCGEGYVARLVAQAGAQLVSASISPARWSLVHDRLSRAVHRAQ